MQRIKNIIFAIVIIIFAYCCESQNSEDRKELQEVYAFLINANATPLPPAPPMPNDSLGSWKIPEHVIDSLKKVKLNIAIYPNLTKPTISESFRINNFPDGFNEMVNQFSSMKSNNYIPIDSINKNSMHNVIIADTAILKQSRDWKEYDLLFSFSNVAFNKTYDKAALTLGVSRSSLWGSGGLFLLQKEKNGKWKIVNNYIYEEW